ncbi:galactose/methyl galactoside ABC transporter permease MglC [Thermoanaerobacterium sp. CMT5567-10]|uniref:galactose/methyl galactoside ABC transporter permease MglC n=1 Tax=Thermoanaerobacterium sp. CMT5567-10 TaxID=3061989 RepID=UPI0026DF0628|nr:galactose/methyl galactoside ABC transporter permease MglC [Thermoanaerobacterium sp. CMT5567-10]MDK2805906.1 methyl-galactoside transport system permease protein [Thermoanaerobacterium sp.]WKV10028.1 galactose/methyl galactoside ABC transporter permease MglC [Thermoanaerobacterium sp. CMT5567-10]
MQNKFKDYLSQYAIYFVLLLLIVVIAIKNPAFISLRVLRDILSQSSTRIIVALGASFAILIGGADLSAGRMVGFAAVISASLLQTANYPNRFFPGLPQLPIIVPLLITIAVGFIFGLLNGFVISKFSVPPFIATLGSMVVIYGADNIYFSQPPNNSQPIAGLRSDFTHIGTGSIFGVPYLIIIAALMTIIMWIILNKTSFGKDLYAIGGNREAAIVSGVNVTRRILLMFAIAGALYALAGFLEAARTGGATSEYGNMYELDAIAACVVGGWSVSGGVGTIPGIIVGVFIFTVINYGLTFIGMNPYWQLIIKGLIIVSAVAVDIRKYLAKK